MVKSSSNITTSVLADLVSVSLAVPSSTATTLIHEFLRRKIESARETLHEKLRTGAIDEMAVASEDDAIGVIWRFGVAVRDVTAKRNLRLLANVIVGPATRDKLFADEFCKYSDVLSSLSRDQIFVAGCFYRLLLTQREETTGAKEGPDAWSALMEENRRRCSRRLPRRAARWQRIAVRINADVGAATHDKISAGRAHDKFGIARPRALADDLLAVRSAGAYGSVMASTYNGRLLVPEARVNGTQFPVVRPRPDYDAMLAGETMAPWQAEEAASRGAA